MRKPWRIKGNEYYDFYPFVDDKGNVLGEEDILFVSEKELKNRQQVEIWGDEEEETSREGVHINTPGVRWICEEEGKFPIAVETPDGELLCHKISKKSGNSIPNHAGCAKVIRLIMIGAASSGKSVYTLQLSDPAFHNMISKHTNVSFEDDLPTDAFSRYKYEIARENFKKGILPEPSKKNEDIAPYYYYVQCGDMKNKEDAILKIQDIDGETCKSIKLDSKILQCNHLNLVVGADDLIEGERGGEAQYDKVLDQLLPHLRVLQRTRNYEISVTISKGDLLDRKNPYLKGAFENSISHTNGKYTQKIHEAGLNYEIFNKRSECVEKFLKEECPNFYRKLCNVVKKDNLTFCMIASVGEECHDNRYENYKPFCIDEPILAIMAKSGLYPIAVEDYNHEVNKIPGLMSSDFVKELRRIYRMVKNTFAFRDSGRDEEGWQ